MNNNEFIMLDLFERTPDLVCIVDRPGYFIKINPAVVETLGYTEAELMARPVSVLIHPDDRNQTHEFRNRLLNNEPLINFQNRYLAKDGSIVWLQWTSVYIPEQEFVFAIAKNITEKKLVELEVEENMRKYKDLTAHFKHHVEKDRLFFASELHEEFAQLATVIKMDFEWLASLQLPLDEMAKKRLAHGMTTTQTLIDKIRKLSYSMSPTQISEIGLDPVLQTLCAEFTIHTGIPCSYESSFLEQDIEPEIRLDLFRICQEALLNVMHHAQATKVSIVLEEKENKIELTIKDNGKGFDHENRQSFGLRNMHGRAASVNGELTIESTQSKGTQVRVRVEKSK